MKANALPILLLAAGLAACDQESQPLPFDVAQTTVSRTISSSGGVISLPGAASVEFPAGALSGSAEVTLSALTGAAPAAGGGAAASAWYQVQPSALALAQPAGIEVKFDPEMDRNRSWLTSVVVSSPLGLEEIGPTRLDLTTGIASAETRTLGSFAAVVPPAAAVFPVHLLGAAAPAGPATAIARRVGSDSVAILCGPPEIRCGGITIEASANLLEKVDRAAVLYPSIRGGLKLDRFTSTVRGRIGVEAVIRVLLQSGTTTASVALDVDDFLIEQRVVFPFPTGSASASKAGAAADGTIVIRVTDTVQIVNANGQTENATVAISFPVQLY